MDLGLKDKIVLITGGSKGLGFACAQAFIAEGAHVIIVARDATRLANAVERLGGKAESHAVDLTDADAAAAMVAAVAARHGRIDVLINSAGAAQRTSFEDLTPAAFRGAMDAKFFTYVHALDAVMKQMMKQRDGNIVNIIGMGGKMARTTHLAGGAANAALMLVTSGMAAAAGPFGIRVNAINPGPSLTERLNASLGLIAQKSGRDVETVRQQEARDIPLGRFGDPEEIANVAVFLASPRASYVSGAQIAMDGASTPTVI